jgi:hypothetical protein
MKREVLPARKAPPKPLLVDPVFLGVLIPIGLGAITNFAWMIWSAL